MNKKIIFLLLLILLFFIYNFVIKTKENFNQVKYPELSFTIENAFFSPIEESLHKYLVKILAIDNSNIVSESNDDFKLKTFTSSNPGEAKNTINNKEFRKYESEFRVKNNFYKKLINSGNQNSPTPSSSSPSPSGSDNITIETMTNVNYTDEEKENIKVSYLNYITNLDLEVFKNLGSNKEKNHIFLKNKNLVDLNQESTGIFCLDSNCEINFNLEDYSLNHNFDSEYNNSVVNPIRTYLENFIPFFEYIKQKENKDKIMGIVLDNHLLNFGIITREVEITENNDSFTFDIIYKTEVFNYILPITEGNSFNYYFNNKNLKRQNELIINKNILNQKGDIIDHFVVTAISWDKCTTYNPESINRNCPYQHRNVNHHIIQNIMNPYAKNFNEKLLEKTVDELNIGKKYFFEILKYFFINDKNLFDFIEFKYYSDDDSEHWTDKKINPGNVISMKEVIIANNNFNIVNDTFLNENNLDDEEHILKLYFNKKFNYDITEDKLKKYVPVTTENYMEESNSDMGLVAQDIEIDGENYKKYTITSTKEMEVKQEYLTEQNINLKDDLSEDTINNFKEVLGNIVWGSSTVLEGIFNNHFDNSPLIFSGYNPVIEENTFQLNNFGISFDLKDTFNGFDDDIFYQRIEREQPHEVMKKLFNNFKKKIQYLIQNYEKKNINYLIFDEFNLNIALVKINDYKYVVSEDKKSVKFLYKFQIDIFNKEVKFNEKTYKLNFDYIRTQILDDQKFYSSMERILILCLRKKNDDFLKTLSTEEEKYDFWDFNSRVGRYYILGTNENLFWDQVPKSIQLEIYFTILSFHFGADTNVNDSIEKFNEYILKFDFGDFPTYFSDRIILSVFIPVLIENYKISILKKINSSGVIDFTSYSEENIKKLEESKNEPFVSNYIIEPFESNCSDLKLADNSEFVDNQLINPLTCKDFYTRKYCVDGSTTSSYIDDTINLGDISAKEACCICGGGDGGTLNLESLGYINQPSSSPSPSQSNESPSSGDSDKESNESPSSSDSDKDKIGLVFKDLKLNEINKDEFIKLIAVALGLHTSMISLYEGSIVVIINLPNETPDERLEELIQQSKNLIIKIPKKDGTYVISIPEVTLDNKKLENISNGTSTHLNNSNINEFKAVLSSFGGGLHQYKTKGVASVFSPLIDVKK